MHLVGLTTGMYYDARTYERQKTLQFCNKAIAKGYHVPSHERKKCSSETQTSLWMKTVRVIQQAISITVPQSDKCCQLHEARRVYKTLEWMEMYHFPFNYADVLRVLANSYIMLWGAHHFCTFCSQYLEWTKILRFPFGSFRPSCTDMKPQKFYLI